MKFLLYVLLAATGYAVFNEDALGVVKTQPTWLICVEAVVVYLAGLYPSVVESSARIALQYEGQKRPDKDDMGLACLFSIFWPVTVPVWLAVRLIVGAFDVGERMIKGLGIGTIGDHAAARMKRIRDKKK